MVQMIKKDFKRFLIDHNEKTIDAIKRINKLGGRSLIVTSNNNIFKGILSFADLRKAILNHNISNKKINKIYNKKPRFIYLDELESKIEKISLSIKKLHIIPVVERKSGNIVDVIQFDKINEFSFRKKTKKLNASVIIMAGGKGTRLLPYTSVLPKPLLPINKKPTISHIINKFREYNIKKFFVTLNYKSELIKTYLKNLRTINPIVSIVEKKPLGTAGSLFLIKNKIKNDFFLTNCDTIIHENYYNFYKMHKKEKNDITVIAAKKKFKIPYGICEIKDNNFKIEEKPKLTCYVNTGFYIISKNCLNVLKRFEYLDFNDFLNICKKNNKKIGVIKIKEKNWIDVGQMKEYKDNLYKNI